MTFSLSFRTKVLPSDDELLSVPLALQAVAVRAVATTSGAMRARFFFNFMAAALL